MRKIKNNIILQQNWVTDTEVHADAGLITWNIKILKNHFGQIGKYQS